MISLTASDGHSFKAWEAGSAESPSPSSSCRKFSASPPISAMSATTSRPKASTSSPRPSSTASNPTSFWNTQAGVTEGLELRSKIPSEKTLADIAACAKALREAGHKKVGIIGFCWGGLLAWLTATRTHDVDAAVSWYGGSIGNHVETAPHCPVELHFGGEDSSIPIPKSRRSATPAPRSRNTSMTTQATASAAPSARASTAMPVTSPGPAASIS